MDTAFRARAILLAARFDLRNWPEGETLARAPLAIRGPNGGVAVLFRFGLAVLFGMTPKDEEELRGRLLRLVEKSYQRPEIEELDVRVDPCRAEGLHEGPLVVRSGSLEALQVIRAGRSET